MLNSAIVVDLPSTLVDRSKTATEWVRSLFGAKLDLRGDHEELTISAMSLVAGLVESFWQAKVTDVISFVVDKKVVYIDTREVPDDLALMLEAATQKGILDRRFSEMHVVLSHKEAGLHVLIDVRIRNRVLEGEEEMAVALSARVEELQIRAGETPADYRARIQAYMADGSRADANRLALDGLTERVAGKLGTALVGARVTTQPATVRIIAPGAPQVSRFRKLRFGDAVEGPRYRAVPTYQRAGAYADPFYYYYYDPYYDFMSWVMVDSMLHHQYWSSPSVQVIDTGGQLLGTGDAMDVAAGGWAGRDVVSFDGNDGSLAVASSIPDVDDGQRASWFGGGDGTSSADGSSSWGGGDASASDGVSSSDSGGSDGGSSSCSSSSGSSCGSSCSSGSSCGSSCGGS